MPQTQSPPSPSTSSPSASPLMTPEPTAQSLFALRVLVIVLGIIFVFCAALFVYLLITVEPKQTTQNSAFAGTSSTVDPADVPSLGVPSLGAPSLGEASSGSDPTGISAYASASPRSPDSRGSLSRSPLKRVIPDIALEEGESIKSYSFEGPAITVLLTSPSQSRLILIDMQNGTTRVIARFSPESLAKNQ